MSASRDHILARIRAATGGAGRLAGGDVDAAYAALPRDYLRAHHDDAIAALFAERAADYRAVVERVPEPGLAAAIARVMAGRGQGEPRAFVVPAGLPARGPAEAPAATRPTPAPAPPSPAPPPRRAAAAPPRA